jgi:hypothetical protein
MPAPFSRQHVQLGHNLLVSVFASDADEPYN